MMAMSSYQSSAQVSKDNAVGDFSSGLLLKKINNEKDVIHFKTIGPAYKSILTYVEALSDLIQATGNKYLNYKYTLQSDAFKKCAKLFENLEKLCDNTDLKQSKSASSFRFGYVAFRDWHDAMKIKCKEFIDDDLACGLDEQARGELLMYLTESFGNKMRIDYGTGHELNFIIFTMGLILVVDNQIQPKENTHLKVGTTAITPTTIKDYVKLYGWEVHSLFAHKYLRLCRSIQKKFRLEPAGSRGVYNLDDYQFLPFLFGAAQLVDVKYISCNNFYDYEQIDMWKNDFIFFETIDYILKNKRGPFNEHSYTLWCFSSLGSWSNIYRKIKLKFIDDVLSPFPVIQHLLFGKCILVWE